VPYEVSVAFVRTEGRRGWVQRTERQGIEGGRRDSGGDRIPGKSDDRLRDGETGEGGGRVEGGWEGGERDREDGRMDKRDREGKGVAGT
jgi:hypothetical protein